MGDIIITTLYMLSFPKRNLVNIENYVVNIYTTMHKAEWYMHKFFAMSFQHKKCRKKYSFTK